MPGHYSTTPPPPPKQGRKDIDFWESKQGDGSAGTYKEKLVPGGSRTKGTYTPERD